MVHDTVAGTVRFRDIRIAEYDDPHIITKQIEVKPDGTVEANVEFPAK